MPNEYSTHWFSTFLSTVPAERTAKEIAFLRRQIPSGRFPRILDLGCGHGRHSFPLASNGYEVTAVDINGDALAEARRLSEADVRFVQTDMRDLAEVGQDFDAVICMWQSFGYFDETGNRKVLDEVSACLRPGGRFVLDIYDRRFFEHHFGVRTIERDGKRIRETSVLSKGRLSVRLVYDDTNQVDEFDWEVFSPATFAELAEAHGLRLIRSCCGFDEEKNASGDMPRMQLILVKDGR